ncbi:Uncharacterized membrane-anchored protein [Leuconostocaceae bacterium R-53105]|uniref:Putative membrane-anchored protein n=1 Tax=Convivina intestini TaxID=1505726 RepID=A0A2U1D608_9LACO|nr:putative membrane-anchored protein [Convivina intestini]CAH1856716.1 hypothetical protein R077811_01318 [Convivina intestini]SDB97369.1 Uncharacterized membrane-anchored protein [Leuconostocaceae bacterium R-53105]
MVNIVTENNRELTKKNQDFIFQLKKHLDQADMPSDKIEGVVQEVTDNLLEKQGKGTTASQLYGSPLKLAQHYLDPNINAKKLHDYPAWVLAVDTSSVLLMFMTLFFAITTGISAGSQQGQGVGIVSAIFLSIWGGVLYTVVMLHLIPNPKSSKKINKWSAWLLIPLILVAWVGGFLVTVVIPAVINPVLPGYGNVAVAAVTFLIYRWNRKQAGIPSGGILAISKLAQQARVQNQNDKG